MDEATRQKLVNKLVRRLEGLSGLHDRDVIDLTLLGRQLFQLVCTQEAWSLACSLTDEEREARRLLIRLHDPDRWRKDSAESEEKRRNLLEERLVEAFLGEGVSSPRLLDSLIDVACLPHFIGFVRDRAGFKDARPSGGRVKVLD
ncbi:hypothetical protein GX411_04550 [Candidatus Fermentibacteria bacterium]|nr:hypothetical protein [Candidatus Fermentibacteria bacterium]